MNCLGFSHFPCDTFFFCTFWSYLLSFFLSFAVRILLDFFGHILLYIIINSILFFLVLSVFSVLLLLLLLLFSNSLFLFLLLLLFFFYYFIRDVGQPLSQIRMSASMSLGAGQIIFLAGINATENKVSGPFFYLWNEFPRCTVNILSKGAS